MKKSQGSVKRILIIYWGYLGDILITTPLLEALRRGFPNSYIMCVIGEMVYFRRNRPYGLAAKILEQNPHVDKCIRSDVSILRTLILDKPYDLVIDLCGNRASELMAKASGANLKLWGKFRQIPSSFFYSECSGGKWTTPSMVKIPFKKYRYRVRQFLEIARYLGVNIKGIIAPKIYLSEKERRFSRRYLKKLRKKGGIVIGMHPGGHASYRLWDSKNYALLADRLAQRHSAKVIVFYAPGEERFVKRLRKFARHRISAVLKSDIRRYISMVNCCDAFVTCDGGPLHIALSLGVPSVGIFKKEDIINIAYWYNYKRRKGLFSAFVKHRTPDTGREDKITRTNIKETELVLRKTEEAIGIFNP